MYVCMYVCTYVCTYVYMYVCMYVVRTIHSLVQEFYYDGDGLSGPVTTEFHEQHNYQCRTIDIISGLRQEYILYSEA